MGEMGEMGDGLHQAGSYWVPVHIRQRPAQVTGTQTAGEKAILPKMACPPASRVVVLRISSVYPPEEYC